MQTKYGQFLECFGYADAYIAPVTCLIVSVYFVEKNYRIPNIAATTEVAHFLATGMGEID